MSSLSRYAAAIYHLGARQAALNVLHRAGRPLRRFSRYGGAAGDLRLAAAPAVPLLAHGGGARLDDGRLTAVGLTRAVGDPPRWDEPAPLLWTFNLHYFGFLHALDPEHGRRLMLDWIDRNPPRPGSPGWMPYPLSLRLRHWIQRLIDGPRLDAATEARVLASIEGQADCLADTLEWHLRGNHLLESGITLSILGACLRGSGAGRWKSLGAQVLETELAEQFLPDGGHFERSAMYHARLVHGLLDLLNVLPETDESRFDVERRLPGMLRILAAMRHPDGEIALFNDAAFGQASEPGAILDYAERLGYEVPRYAAGSFPETGYHVWRDGPNVLVVDAGPLGPDYLPGHGHGDLFSYELSLEGRRVVLDGGTSTYEAGPERDWVRSTRAHNTVEIDGADQAEFFGAFRVGRRPRPRDVRASVDGSCLQVSGWHDGYRRLAGRPIHHRELLFAAPATLAVWDRVEASHPRPAVSRVRLPPQARVRVEPPGTAVVEIEGLTLTLGSFGGTLAVEDGHYAPRFGERVACPVLALVKHDAADFGYVLARSPTPGRIDPAAAHVGARQLARGAVRPGAPA
jgi:uncharacterized heparinase superfamily protein